MVKFFSIEREKARFFGSLGDINNNLREGKHEFICNLLFLIWIYLEPAQITESDTNYGRYYKEYSKQLSKNVMRVRIMDWELCSVRE